MIIIIITIVNINHVEIERMFQGHHRFLKLEKMKISTTKASYFSPGKNEGGPAQNKVSKASLIVVITIIINSHPRKEYILKHSFTFFSLALQDLFRGR